MNTKAYIVPKVEIVSEETQEDLLTMSISNKEISNLDNVGLTKEDFGDWGDIWEDE